MQDLNLLGMALLGYSWQWLRALKNVPNWASWALMGVVAAGVYVFITRDFALQFHTSWRDALAGLATFILGARGAASTSSDTGAAKPTNSL
jgi:hypothetical protein